MQWNRLPLRVINTDSGLFQSRSQQELVWIKTWAQERPITYGRPLTVSVIVNKTADKLVLKTFINIWQYVFFLTFALPNSDMKYVVIPLMEGDS